MTKKVYKYELWSGKRMVGYYITNHFLVGKVINFYDYDNDTYFVVPIDTIYKQNEDLVSWTSKTILNVSRKSKRQIKLIRGQ